MRRIHSVLWLSAILISAALYAQTRTMEATIPFEFRIGNSVMPAGSYRVDYSPQMLRVREEHGNHIATRLLNSVDRVTPPSTGVLEFTRYGNDYFFSKIWIPGSAAGGALPKSSLEKELASRPQVPERAEVALRGK